LFPVMAGESTTHFPSKARSSCLRSSTSAHAFLVCLDEEMKQEYSRRDRPLRLSVGGRTSCRS
jgi:hypothetical protein